MDSSIAAAAKDNAKIYSHVAYGMPFESEEPIPGLAETPRQENAVRIRFGAVPQAIENPDYQDKTVQASAADYLFFHPGGWRIYIKGDREIVVEKPTKLDPVRMWSQILNIGASIAGFRNGFIPLHASAVEADGGCIALAGQSGFGKSTLAASLVTLGFTLHADDLCLVRPAVSGLPLVGNGVREVRLSQNAVEALDWSGGGNAEPIPGTGKTIYRVAADRPSLLPLKRIYVLQYAGETKPAGIHRLAGVAAMQALIGCLRLRLGLLSVGAQQKSFESLTSISSAVEVYRFVRPHDRRQLSAWSERLAAHLSVQREQR